MELQPDRRTLQFYVPLGLDGRPAAMSLESLRAKAAEWPVAPATPPEIGELLRVARDLYVHSLFVQEFATVGVAWSLHAVESALRLALPQRVDKRATFEKLLDQALAKDLIDVQLRERLDAGRSLRNRFSHPGGQEIWPPSQAAEALHTSHKVVHHLFEGAPDTAGSQQERQL